MRSYDQMFSVTSKDRSFTVVPHLLIWDYAKGRDRNLYFASYVGVPESVMAVTASVLEGREIRYRHNNYSRLVNDPYKRIQKIIGMGDVAHGCVYNSMFELAEVEGAVNPEKFNRALIFAPDGNIHQAVVEHAMARFGLPREWQEHYAALLDDFWRSLYVEANSEFAEWREAKAALFSATEAEVIEKISSALRRGRLSIPHSSIQGEFDPTWTMSTYMVSNAESLAKQLEEKQPRHVFTAQIDPAIADLIRIPFPVQAHMVQGLVNTLEDEAPACGGDMGSGKSIIACGVSHVFHERKKRRGSKRGTAVLLSAPGITLSKWEHKEIRGTIPNVGVNIIRSGNDALQLLRKVRNGYRPAGLEFTLVGIDRAKLGSELFFSGVWKQVRRSQISVKESPYAWHCPDCGKPIMVPLDKKAASKEDLVPADWGVFAEGYPPTSDALFEARLNKKLLPNGLPKGYTVKWRRDAGMPRSCTNSIKVGHEVEDETCEGRSCLARFWRPALKSRCETKNRPRVNISQVLKRTKRYFDLYFCDEAHQCKAENSGRGDAFAQMVKSAKATVMLTGTLTNGKSSSIKELLWRTDPKSLLDAGFDHKTGSLDWAKRFGKIEEIVRMEEGDEGVVTRRKNRETTVREAPGIAPHMTASFLVHKAGFIELSDMGLPLVELKEIPVFLDMDPEHKAAYTHFHETLYDACAIASQVSGEKGVWSKFNPATLVYADRPDLGMSVKLGDDVIHAPKLSDGSELHAKERWLLETIEKELSEGRRVVIYNNYTGAYGMNERIHDILTRHGIRCQILDEPNTDLRAERIAEYEEDGMPVLICNMKLVEVGLDLMFWPTIIYYQLNNEVSTVRQSSRRAWRIGQHRECRTYYCMYNVVWGDYITTQMKQFLAIMSARGHALMVEGRLDKSDLAGYSRDSQSSLASDLALCLDTAQLSKAWSSLAAKELEGVEIIGESDFGDVLKQRMKDLADETLRLCGVDPVQWREARASLKAIADVHHIQLNPLVNGDESDVDIRVLDLFEIFAQNKAEEIVAQVVNEDEARELEVFHLMTFTELIATSNNRGKAKGKKQPKKTHQDQLLFNFG